MSTDEKTTGGCPRRPSRNDSTKQENVRRDVACLLLALRLAAADRRAEAVALVARGAAAAEGGVVVAAYVARQLPFEPGARRGLVQLQMSQIGRDAAKYLCVPNSMVDSSHAEFERLVQL